MVETGRDGQQLSAEIQKLEEEQKPELSTRACAGVSREPAVMLCACCRKPNPLFGERGSTNGDGRGWK